MRYIFVRLTRLDEVIGDGAERRDTRQRVAMEELVSAETDPAAMRLLIARLADTRLLVTRKDHLSGQDEVEVAHEALIRYWPQLQEWLDKDRRALQLHADL